MTKTMDYTRIDLPEPERTRYISSVDFHNDNVTAEQCNRVIMTLARDPLVTAAELGLLALLYAHALKGGVHAEIKCREGDLAGLSLIKFAYPYVPEDGKLKVRLYQVGDDSA